MRRSTLTTSLYSTIGLIGLIILWWAGSVYFGNDLLLPSPAETMKALAEIVTGRGFAGELWATASRVLKGFLFSLSLGAAIGAACGFSWKAKALFSPVLAALRTVPFISLSILAIIWFPSGTVPVFVAFLMAYPIVVTNIIEGFDSVDPLLTELSTVFRVPLRQKAARLYLPSMMPYVVSAASQALGMSWKIVVSAEVLSMPARGIGSRMDSAKAFLQMPQLFAWTALLVALGFITDAILEAFRARAFSWREGRMWRK